ncbi:MAG TPA: ABC transporter permease [Puia sp.]|uniref:ABC transporter permease n=1 Tax=Puia sp. TaxID=2045100 RepID=UPI002BA1A829|nr:ABC transporter permease [Puia sp.]HVU98570.1 ABC transporter permease [Puia sp.]
MFGSFWKTAWRNIVRHPAFALINVLGLALGICFCLVIFLVVRYEFSFDRFHPGGERTYLIGRRHGTGPNAGDTINESKVVTALPEGIRREVSGVEAVTGFFDFDRGHPFKVPNARSRSGFTDVTPSDNSPWGDVLVADASYFSLFHYQWLAGTPAILQKPFQVVLSASRARQYYGDLPNAEIMGKQLILDDTVTFTVGGVVKDWTERSDLVSNVFLSESTMEVTGYKKRYALGKWYSRVPSADVWTFLRLSPGTDVGRVLEQLQTIAKANMSFFTKQQLSMLPLMDLHFSVDYPRSPIRKVHRPTLYGVVALALFILLLAVINFINLSTAQSIRRSREVGIRKVLGSGRAALASQFLLETFIVVGFALMLATALVPVMLRVFSDYIPEGVKFVLDGTAVFFLLGIWVVTTLLAGFYPARVLSGYRPVISLRGAAEYQGNSAWNLRRGLIIFQFTVSLGFIICTLVVGRQVSYMLNTDYGIKRDAVLLLNTNWNDSLSKLAVLQNKLAGLPRVAGVVRQSGPPFNDWGFSRRNWAAGAGDSLMLVEMNECDESFIPFYGIRIVAGRNLRHTDSLQELVINESATRYFGFASPEKAVGQFLYYPNNDNKNKRTAVPIAGVVADFHTASFQEAIRPVVMGNVPQEERWLGIRLAVGGRGAEGLKKGMDDVLRVFKSVYPGREADYGFMDEVIASFYAEEQKLSRLVCSAMIVTVFISCMGLFGVALFAVEKRTREVSIRKVLGASVRQIVVLLCRDFIALVVLAMVIATPIAWWYMHRWLDGFAYRVSVGIPLFLAAGACGISVALLTIGWQAVRVARTNPVDHLKAE